MLFLKISAVVTKNISTGKPSKLPKTIDTAHEESDGENGDKNKIIAMVVGCLFGGILAIGNYKYLV